MRFKKSDVNISFYMEDIEVYPIMMRVYTETQSAEGISTEIIVSKKSFEENINPDGSEKFKDASKNVKTIGGIRVTSLLKEVKDITYYILSKQKRNEYSLQDVLKYVTDFMSRNIPVWQDNLEWNVSVMGRLDGEPMSVSQFNERNLRDWFQPLIDGMDEGTELEYAEDDYILD